jgi:hypothetical protein
MLPRTCVESASARQGPIHKIFIACNYSLLTLSVKPTTPFTARNSNPSLTEA